MSDRLARGAGADLLQGNGSNKPLGLIPSLIAHANSAVVTAAGSSENTGGSETGANSIGSRDLTRLLYSVPAPYRRSPKCAWLMNSNTVRAIAGLVDKIGQPLIKLDSDDWKLYGKRVLIDEAMDDISASAIPVIAGDLSYWLTRMAVGDFYIRRYTQAPSLVEKGEFALALFARIGGQLLFDDPNAPSPIYRLQCHS